MTSKALRPGTFSLTALLGLFMSFGPLSIDLYLPSMPAIGRAFAASEPQVQLTLSLYLIGYAFGQVTYGPISDRFGRKPVMITGLLVFCAGSVIGFSAQALEVVIAGRIAQALGASGAMVVTRAVVRDLYEGARAGHQLSSVGVIMSATPIAAPIIGGVLLTLGGWRAGFAFQFVIGALALLLATRYLGETHRPTATPLQVILANYRTVAANPVFLANLGFGSLAYGGLFAWIAGSPFVLQSLHGLTPFQFGLCYAVSCVGYMLGSVVATRLVLRIGLDRTAGVGVTALALASACAMLSVAVDTALPVTLTLSMALFLTGMGIVFPQALAGALMPFPHLAGTASSAIGFANQVIGATITIAVGSTLGATAWPMAIGAALSGTASMAIWTATRKLRTRPAKAIAIATGG